MFHLFYLIIVHVSFHLLSEKDRAINTELRLEFIQEKAFPVENVCEYWQLEWIAWKIWKLKWFALHCWKKYGSWKLNYIT